MLNNISPQPGTPSSVADAYSTNSEDDSHTPSLISDGLSVGSDTDTDSTQKESDTPNSPLTLELIAQNKKLTQEYILQESKTLLPKVVHACLWRAKKLDIPLAFNTVLYSWLKKSLSQIEIFNDEEFDQVVCISEHLLSVYYIFTQILDNKSKIEFQLLDEKQKCESLERDLLTSLLLALKVNSDRAYWNSDFTVFYYNSLGKDKYPIEVFLGLQQNMLTTIASYFAINGKLSRVMNTKAATECENLFCELLQVFAKPQQYFNPFSMKHAVYLKQKLDRIKIFTKSITEHLPVEDSDFDKLQCFTENVDNTHAFLCKLLTPFSEKLKAINASEVATLNAIHWKTSWKSTTDLQSFIMKINSESSLYYAIFVLQSQDKETDWAQQYKRLLTRDDACITHNASPDFQSKTSKPKQPVKI